MSQLPSEELPWPEQNRGLSLGLGRDAGLLLYFLSIACMGLMDRNRSLTELASQVLIPQDQALPAIQKLCDRVNDMHNIPPKQRDALLRVLGDCRECLQKNLDAGVRRERIEAYNQLAEHLSARFPEVELPTLERPHPWW